MPNIRYVKQNIVHFRSPEDRERGTNTFIEFFDNMAGQEMKGHMILQSMSNPNESIVLTFWEVKEEMDKFYSRDNNVLADLVERVKPLFERMPERTDYALSASSFTPAG
jgi:heme-degrading monooxygenase HmoA